MLQGRLKGNEIVEVGLVAQVKNRQGKVTGEIRAKPQRKMCDGVHPDCLSRPF